MSRLLAGRSSRLYTAIKPLVRVTAEAAAATTITVAPVAIPLGAVNLLNSNVSGNIRTMGIEPCTSEQAVSIEHDLLRVPGAQDTSATTAALPRSFTETVYVDQNRLSISYDPDFGAYHSGGFIREVVVWSKSYQNISGTITTQGNIGASGHLESFFEEGYLKTNGVSCQVAFAYAGKGAFKSTTSTTTTTTSTTSTTTTTIPAKHKTKHTTAPQPPHTNSLVHDAEVLGAGIVGLAIVVGIIASFSDKKDSGKRSK